MPDVGFDQRLNTSIPLDLSFKDESSRDVTLGYLVKDKPVVLVLGYYRCPRICSVVFSNLAKSLRTVNYQCGKDYSVVVVSIDPRETPDLARQKKSAMVDPSGQPADASGWHFLTGNGPMIRQLADAVGFRYEYDSTRDLYIHPSGIIFLTKEGKVARYLFGVDYLSRDLRFAVEDASAGAIGSPIAQPLRLLCFAYDPAAGRYTLMTMRLVQCGAALTAVIMGAYLLLAWQRAKRPAT
jgi:protein SCO1/2